MYLYSTQTESLTLTLTLTQTQVANNVNCLANIRESINTSVCRHASPAPKHM